MEGSWSSSVDLSKRKRDRRFCGHCNDFVSHALFYTHRKTFFRNGVWNKDANFTTEDNPGVDMKIKLEDCAHDESSDSPEVKNAVCDVPSDNFGSIEEGSLCKSEEDMHFSGNPDSPERLLDLSSVSDDDKTEVRNFLGFSTPETMQPASSPLSVNDLLEQLISSQRQLEGLVEKQAAQIANLEETVQRLGAAWSKLEKQIHVPKKAKRAHNTGIAEAVRRLHNSENNVNKFDPQTGINSPRNQAVMSYLLEELKSTFTNADPECIKSSCKTYYETLRRKYTLSQPGKSQLRDSIKTGLKKRQRKRRLLESRSKVIGTDAERILWQTATLELMSDEEDAIVDGRPVWVVKSPPHRNPELSDLCQLLQHRLEADIRYHFTHRQRLRTNGTQL